MRSEIRYSQVWEDPRVIQKALEIVPGDSLLCITGAGCNVLNLLLREPATIWAVDSNPAQNHLLRLKLTAVEHLSLQEFALLLGISTQPFSETGSARHRRARRALFKKIVPHLEHQTASYWQANLWLIEKGLHFQGKLERLQHAILRFYRRDFKERWLSAFHQSSSLGDQEEIYKNTINEGRSLRFYRIFVNRFTLRAFRSRSKLRELDRFDFGEDILRKFRTCVTTLTVSDNYFLSSLLFQAYVPPNAIPPYLEPANYQTLKALVERVRVFDGSAEEFLSAQSSHTIQKFNLSNILEWSDRDACDRNLRQVLRVNGDDGRLVIHSTFNRNFHVPADLQDRFVSLRDELGDLESISRSIFPGSIRAFAMHPA